MLPPRIVSISSFRNDVDRLCKKSYYGYDTCLMDISEKFKNLKFEDIWELPHRVRDMSGSRLIKIRIENSGQNLSASHGFRLYLICKKVHEQVALLCIYPKRGKCRRDDIGVNELKIVLNEFAQESKSSKLEEFTFIESGE